MRRSSLITGRNLGSQISGLQTPDHPAKFQVCKHRIQICKPEIWHRAPVRRAHVCKPGIWHCAPVRKAHVYNAEFQVCKSGPGVFKRKADPGVSCSAVQQVNLALPERRGPTGARCQISAGSRFANIMRECGEPTFANLKFQILEGGNSLNAGRGYL